MVAPVVGEARPRWSVMLPCYNDADLLQQALESVLTQDPGPEVMQIEVVDDASSTGDPAGVVERLGAGRVTLYRHPRRVGAPRNFTTCVQRARGHWVHVLHSDDHVLPNFYERYGAQIDRCPDAVMVGGPSITTAPDGTIAEITAPLPTHDGYLTDAAVTFATRHPLRFVSVVVARAAYEAVGGFDPALVHANDWEMWTRLASRGPVAWVEEPLAVYRLHEASDTSRLHQSTRYLTDCLTAVDVMSGHFGDPATRRAVRRDARRYVSNYALATGFELTKAGQHRLALRNAARALAIDRSPDVRRRSRELLGVVWRGRRSTAPLA